MSATDSNSALLRESVTDVLDRFREEEEAESAEETMLGDARGNVIGEWAVERIVVTMFPLLAVTSLLQMGSGSVLQTFEDQLLANPSLLILVPVQIGTAGNLGSIMCARLSTQLHLGTFELSPTNPDIRANVGAVLGLAATVFVLLGFSAWAIGQALGGTLALAQVMIISVVSGMVLAVWVVAVSIGSIYASYQYGYDPDDVTIPIVTNVCDITGVLILFGVVMLVL